MNYETKKAALDFVKFLPKFAKPKGATAVGLYGNLGAGKTTFTQYAANFLGVRERLISPTFIIERIYNIPKNNLFKKLIHIDAYRLENSKELKSLGFKELLKDKRNLIFIEWAGRVAEILPKNHTKIFFEFAKKGKGRKISYG